jgi:hypothetical protein
MAAVYQPPIGGAKTRRADWRSGRAVRSWQPMTEKKAEPTEKGKKTLTDEDLVSNRKHRAGSVGSVGAQAPGAKKILDPGGKRGQVGDPDA